MKNQGQNCKKQWLDNRTKEERQRSGIDPTLAVAHPATGAPCARDANFHTDLKAMLGSNQPVAAALTTEQEAANPSLQAAPEQQDYLFHHHNCQHKQHKTHRLLQK